MLFSFDFICTLKSKFVPVPAVNLCSGVFGGDFSNLIVISGGRIMRGSSRPLAVKEKEGDNS